jgi:hypothetical protein
MNRNKKQVRTRLLSFDDEEEEEEEVKKEKLTIPKNNAKVHEFKRNSKTKPGFVTTTKKKDNLKTFTRTYDHETLNNLKQNVEEMYKEKDEEEYEEVVKQKSFKNENDEIITEDYIEKIPKQNLKDSIKILDQFTIENAKLKRKRVQSEKDFIPLEKEEKNDNESNSSMSEEEEDEEVFDDHKGKKIQFAKNSEKSTKLVDIMDVDLSEEQDSDEDNWQDLQMQNAGFKITPQPTQPKKFEMKKEIQIPHIESFEKVQKELNETLRIIHETNQNDEKELKLIEDSFNENHESVEQLISNFQQLNDQYIFYQKMRSYIEDLVDCIDKKVPDVEDCENEILTTRREFHEQKRQKWIQYQKDKIDFIYHPDKTMRISSFETSNETLSIEEIVQDANEIFSDTLEDYSSISKIKSKFFEWKDQYEKSFNDTYCNLSLQKVYAPFIRLELISWDPLSKNSHFYEFPWFRELNEEDEILPNLIKKIIIPRCNHSFQFCYDPFSSEETLNAISLVNDISMFVDVPEDFSVYLVERISTFIDDLVLPDVKFDSTLEFFQIQTKKCFNLIQNILKWKEKLNFTEIQKLLEKLNLHLKNYYQVDFKLKNELEKILPNEFKYLLK